MADVASRMVSTLDQFAHQIATIENEVSSARMTLAQELTQAVVANVQRRWDHLLGIDPSTQNQSDSGFSQQATPAVSSSHTASPAIVPSANAPRNSVRPFGGSGQPDAWNPVPNGDYLWSDPLNWSTGVVPENGLPATFDGNVNNSKCIVDVNTTQGLTTLQNGYTATITIQNGITMNISGFQDNNVGLDNFVVAFAGPNAVQNYGPGQDVMGDFSWEAGGKTTVNGGNVTIGNGAGLNQSTASPVIINSGVVSIGPTTASGASTFDLTNGSADINVNPNGQLDFYLPNTTDILVSNTGTAAQISNNGTTYLINNSFTATAIISAPFENHAQLIADSGGIWRFNRADANGNDLSMDAGQISMLGGVNLTCLDQYTQTGGTLEIADDQPELLDVTGPGVAANFNGGKIVFDSTIGLGTLKLGNVIFNGVEIDMRIAGTTNASDQISCTLGGNTCTIKGNSKLVVTAAQAVKPNLTWTLITPNAGKTITGDFLPANITLPANVVETAGALPNSWQCNS